MPESQISPKPRRIKNHLWVTLTPDAVQYDVKHWKRFSGVRRNASIYLLLSGIILVAFATSSTPEDIELANDGFRSIVSSATIFAFPLVISSLSIIFTFLFTIFEFFIEPDVSLIPYALPILWIHLFFLAPVYQVESEKRHQKRQKNKPEKKK